MRNIIVGIDMGSSQVKAAMGEVLHDQRINVLGACGVRSEGLKRGSIVNIEQTARAVEHVLNEIEQLTGVPVDEARICFSSPSIFSFINRTAVAVANPGSEIITSDVDRLLRAGRMVSIPPTHSIIHLLPRCFAVDGMDGVKDPVGMIGHRLEAEILIAAVATSVVQNLLNAGNRAGIKVRDMAVSSLLSAEAVLTPAEREMGVVLVDIGGGTTDIVAYLKGSAVYVSVLPIGGEHITNDLAIGLRTTVTEARSVKEKYGLASVSLSDGKSMVSVPNIYGREVRDVSDQAIASIIEPRVEEIMQLIRGDLLRAGITTDIPGGVVFTGGTAKLRGIDVVGEEYLEMSVRVGIPENICGDMEQLHQPEYAAAIGSLVFGNRVKEVVAEPNREVYHFSKYFERVVDRVMELLR